MKNIAVVTTTRAEYGLLAPIIKQLRQYENDNLIIQVIATGTHLDEKYGKTIQEIEADGVRIDYKIRIPVKSDSPNDISMNQAQALIKFTKLFSSKSFDAVVLLGDRYETLAVAISAGICRIPVFHLCGGDTTEGAIDEWIRHSITKISYLHFVTNEDSRRRVIQLGENPGRVFNYGSTSIDNILNMEKLSKEEALGSIGLANCKYAICTYHPVTLDGGSVDDQIDHFLKAIRAFPDIQFVVTKSNADQGGARINALLEKAEMEIDNLHVYSSLGVRRYLSLMKYAEFVLGNSSSGIVEAPALHITTINIGDRQRGRLQAPSIINCSASTEDIVSAIKEALSDEHKMICKTVNSPYGDGNSAKMITQKIIDTVLESKIDLKKKFYDIR